MGRGRLSAEEIAELKQNRYVINVNEDRIIYSNELKKHFMDEYKRGVKPTEIFRSCGFDPDVLGTKRIERACARWRESDAAGTLGEYGYAQLKQKEDLEQLLKEKQQEIERLKEENRQLKAYINHFLNA